HYPLLPAALVVLAAMLSPFNTNAFSTKDLPARTLEEEAKDDSSTFQQKLGSQVPDAILNISTNSFFSNYVFLIDKTARSLTIWQKSNDGTKAIRHYPTDIGKNQGDKTSLGDHKTPEGIYTFQEMFEGPNLDFSLYGSRAFKISYPNLFDNLLGKTGSGIWLHAVPDTVALTRGSRGCVVVRNGVIKELSQFINLQKTPIIIRDAVQYVTPDMQKKKYQDVAAKIEDWRHAWEQKNLSKYMNKRTKLLFEHYSRMNLMNMLILVRRRFI
ncbi:MAG: L,D-transpeptidase family protein, partial [Bdellovibrionales bacterium]